MNNYDMKDCAMLNNNQLELVCESDRMNDFMTIMEGELDSIGKIFIIKFQI